MDGKWIPVKPGTDTCLAMAIAYVWVEEGTYDKEYVATRTVGFDEFKPYLIGETDGQPKTPEWAEKGSWGSRPHHSIFSAAVGIGSAHPYQEVPEEGEGGACRDRLRHGVLAHDGAVAGHARIWESQVSASGGPAWAPQLIPPYGSPVMVNRKVR